MSEMGEIKRRTRMYTYGETQAGMSADTDSRARQKAGHV